MAINAKYLNETATTTLCVDASEALLFLALKEGSGLRWHKKSSSKRTFLMTHMEATKSITKMAVKP
jgi:hypothetical protein